MPARRSSTALVAPEHLMMDAMRTVTVAFRGWLDEILPKHGMGPAQFWTLSDVADHGPLNAAHLASYRCVTPPTVSVIVDDLVRAGWVERRRSEQDRREVVLSVTPSGRKLIAELWEKIGERTTEASREIPRKDLEVTARVLTSLARRAEGVPSAGGIA
jgi:DNA-binding MarR family transcriptional regulator